MKISFLGFAMNDGGEFDFDLENLCCKINLFNPLKTKYFPNHHFV